MVDSQSTITAIVFHGLGPILSHNLSEQLLKLLEKYAVHCVQCHALILAKPCLREEKKHYYFIDDKMLFRMVSIVSVLNEPVTVQGR